MHPHCHHTPCCHHEPPKVIHDERCEIRRHQRDELKRRALYAYGLWNDPHTPREALCRAMRELLEATDFDR